MIRIKSYNIPQSILDNKNKSLNHRLCLDWSCSTIHTVVTWHSKTFVNDLLSKILKKSIRVENDKTSPGKLFKVLSSSHSTYEVATSNIASRFLFHVFSTCTVGLNHFYWIARFQIFGSESQSWSLPTLGKKNPNQVKQGLPVFVMLFTCISVCCNTALEVALVD